MQESRLKYIFFEEFWAFLKEIIAFWIQIFKEKLKEGI